MAGIGKGWDGHILVGGNEVAQLNSWELSVDIDMLEKTGFGSGQDREFEYGLRNPTGTISGYHHTTDAAMLAILGNIESTTTPSATSIVFITNNTTGAKAGWESTAGCLFSNVSIGAPVDGLQTFSGAVQVSGGLSTYSTTT